jgi:RNA polymerase sigma-70 factor (ECF subfamily)
LTARTDPCEEYKNPGGDDREQAWVDDAGRDPKAFEHLYNLYFSRVYGYVLHRVSRVQESEDIVAETFFKAMNALCQGEFEWRGKSSFALWLFRIAHNAVVSYYRRTGINIGDMMSLDDAQEIEVDDLSQEGVFLQEEEFAHLNGLLRRLPPRRQEIITLRFYGGLRNWEIAAVLGLDERTVASQLCRGIDTLQGYYQAEAKDERDAEAEMDQRTFGPLGEMERLR